jgi:hypothetical protein
MNNTPLNPHLRQTNVGSSVFLLSVPENQKKWFKENYDTIKNEFEFNEHLDYSMFENNLFGINERFIGYKKDRGLIDTFLWSYIDKEDDTGFIKDCFICVLEDCKEFEYFEMAHNINLILMSFETALSAYLKEKEDWYKKNGSNSDAF